MRMDIKEQLLAYSSMTEQALKVYLSDEKIPSDFREVMGYSLFAGGKRLRPALVMGAAELCGGRSEDVMPFACGIEMIHTYSLIHDDLPAIDNDDYRRGRLTSHKAFDEAKAILAGDGLLSFAFEIMLRAALTGKEPLHLLRAAEDIAHAAGVQGMVAGQWVDVRSEGQQLDMETLEYIHDNKTAAMIVGALKAGAHAAGADEPAVTALARYGRELGLTFQIIDDILDVVGDQKELGKPVGSDAANQKQTYVTRLGVEGAFAEAVKHTGEASAALEVFGEKAVFLDQLAQYLLKRRK